MKSTILLTCTALLVTMSGPCRAQHDSIKYQAMRVYEIAEGRKTSHFFVKNQKTYSLDDRLIREITFDDSTRRTLHYTFYFYKDDRLFTEECHDRKDSILYILLHTYDAKGRETGIDRMEWRKGKMKTTGRKVFVYDKSGLKIAMNESGVKKKPFRTTSYIYASGNMVREEAKTRDASGKPIVRITNYEFGPDDLVKSKQILEKNDADTVLIETETYRYNNKGQMIKADTKDPQDRIIISRNYEYYSDGSLRNYYEKDAEGNMLKYYSMVIKYRTINLGTQKSYFDKK